MRLELCRHLEKRASGLLETRYGVGILRLRRSSTDLFEVLDRNRLRRPKLGAYFPTSYKSAMSLTASFNAPRFRNDNTPQPTSRLTRRVSMRFA